MSRAARSGPTATPVTSTELLGPGNYVYEPAGAIDRWAAAGDEPCAVHIQVTGMIEYPGENGEVIESVNADTPRALYPAWCREHAPPQLRTDESS